MAVSLTCTAVVRRAGRHYVRWGDGAELEFDSLAGVRAFIRCARMSRVDGPKDLLRAMLLDWWLEQNQSGDNPALLEGRTVTYNPALPANIVRVT